MKSDRFQRGWQIVRRTFAGSAFVFSRVKFVITTVPRENDLNKLFEVINNRGVQLQHHEILKARMLDALEEVERGSFAVLWDACADMENFVERNLSGNFKGFASEIADCYEKGQLTNASAVREMLAKAHPGSKSPPYTNVIGDSANTGRRKSRR